MGLKLTTDEKAVMVFRKDKEYQGGTFATYSIGVSSKDRDDNWVNGYIDVAFKKGVELQNKSKINIENAFPVVRSYNGKVYTSWMITEFTVVDEGEKAPLENQGFMNVPQGMDDELPFARPTR